MIIFFFYFLCFGSVIFFVLGGLSLLLIQGSPVDGDAADLRSERSAEAAVHGAGAQQRADASAAEDVSMASAEQLSDARADGAVPISDGMSLAEAGAVAAGDSDVEVVPLPESSRRASQAAAARVIAVAAGLSDPDADLVFFYPGRESSELGRLSLPYVQVLSGAPSSQLR